MIAKILFAWSRMLFNDQKSSRFFDIFFYEGTHRLKFSEISIFQGKLWFKAYSSVRKDSSSWRAKNEIVSCTHLTRFVNKASRNSIVKIPRKQKFRYQSNENRDVLNGRNPCTFITAYSNEI